jgi:hypothetical protein
MLKELLKSAVRTLSIGFHVTTNFCHPSLIHKEVFRLVALTNQYIHRLTCIFQS